MLPKKRFGGVLAGFLIKTSHCLQNAHLDRQMGRAQGKIRLALLALLKCAVDGTPVDGDKKPFWKLRPFHF